MADNLPLLVFPKAKPTEAPTGKGFSGNNIHFPNHNQQIKRLNSQFKNLKNFFQASISDTVAGFEPEMVLVIEIIGSVDKFRQAIEKAGLEWFGEWDTDDVEPDEYFYEEDEEEKPKLDKLIPKRLFVSLANQSGFYKLQSLWNQWKKDKTKFNRGEKKWRDVFERTHNVRKWGIKDSLIETGMIDRWRDLINPVQTDNNPVYFQIELFYRKLPEKRKETEKAITQLLKNLGGKKLNSIDIPGIPFHAIKAQLPYKEIQNVLKILKDNEDNLDIKLFNFSGIMYFRPTGQSVTIPTTDIPVEEIRFPKVLPESPPVVAILDGVPNLKHEALNNRLKFDDPDNLSEKYQPGERRHGTAMASLVIHGEVTNTQTEPLSSYVYHLPIMQPNLEARNFGECVEGFPNEVFFEDRIERAVRRMFEGEGSVEAQAPKVKVINLSIADLDRPFIHTISPCARLLDYLSYKYSVLFCVSAGNFFDNINLNMSLEKFKTLTDSQKTASLLKCVEKQLSNRRILSPSESVNSLTIGALHTDKSGDYISGHRVDLQPDNNLFSPISRLGLGFHRSIKPEIYLPGGRKLYTFSHGDYSVDRASRAPGQQVAYDSKQEGNTSTVAYTHGTSNATALATRSGAKIHEMLSQLQKKENNQIPDNLVAVLIKTLLVHGAKHDDLVKETLSGVFTNSKKETIARYIGYGTIDIDRVLKCTEQRGTIIGYGELQEKRMHEYKLPLPISLSNQKMWRRMIVTLAWFSPINPSHRNFREAKLELKPSKKWETTPLSLKRKDSDYNQVSRGTVQHEVLEIKNKTTAIYEENADITLQVMCKSDATERLEEKIPYGLAVTLEVEETVDIPIYQEIQNKLKQPVPIST